jgi:hypothetical protein
MLVVAHRFRPARLECLRRKRLHRWQRTADWLECLTASPVKWLFIWDGASFASETRTKPPEGRNTGGDGIYREPSWNPRDTLRNHVVLLSNR